MTHTHTESGAAGSCHRRCRAARSRVGGSTQGSRSRGSGSRARRTRAARARSYLGGTGTRVADGTVAVREQTKLNVLDGVGHCLELQENESAKKLEAEREAELAKVRAAPPPAPTLVSGIALCAWFSWRAGLTMFHTSTPCPAARPRSHLGNLPPVIGMSAPPGAPGTPGTPDSLRSLSSSRRLLAPPAPQLGSHREVRDLQSELKHVAEEHAKEQERLVRCSSPSCHTSTALTRSWCLNCNTETGAAS